MSIRAVFRVQCDGPGREWLSLTPDYRPGTDILPRHVVAAPTAERACNFPGERAARGGALAAGWRYGFLHTTRTSWLCPGCQANPLGIKLPPSTPEQVAAVESGVMPGSGLDPDDDGRDLCGHGDEPDETCEGCYG